MIYHPRTPQEAVNLRKEHADTAVYLAGGTDDLRLGGAAEGKDLIDITGFDFNTITEKDGKVYIGALCTLQDVIESELVPAFIREAAGFCASFAKRNSATVGGNLGLNLVGRIRIRLSKRKRNAAGCLFCHGGESTDTRKLELVERRVEGKHTSPFVRSFIAIEIRYVTEAVLQNPPAFEKRAVLRTGAKQTAAIENYRRRPPSRKKP